MSKYNENDEWALAESYNTRRGEVLDGSRVSQIPSVKWGIGKHCLDDDSIHYRIIKFLKTQQQNRASVSRINAEINIPHIDIYLRELEKQGICISV